MTLNKFELTVFNSVVVEKSIKMKFMVILDNPDVALDEVNVTCINEHEKNLHCTYNEK